MHKVEQKPYKGAGMEGRVARWYARTRRSDMEDFRQQAKAAAQHLASGARVLEVAPGPGFFAIELAKLGDFKITGLDISRTLVDIAKVNATDAGVQVNFRLGNASAMPFADESFDFIYCAAAFKNFAEPVRALDEMHRVLCPGGEAMIVDLRNDVSLEEIDSYVRRSKRSRFDAWITTMAFSCMLIRRAYSRDDFIRMAQESHFGSCRIGVESIGFEVRLAKQRLAAASLS